MAKLKVGEMLQITPKNVIMYYQSEKEKTYKDKVQEIRELLPKEHKTSIRIISLLKPGYMCRNIIEVIRDNDTYAIHEVELPSIVKHRTYRLQNTSELMNMIENYLDTGFINKH